MAKKKVKQQDDAQAKAIEVLVNNVGIAAETKAALLRRLKNDLEDLEGDLLALQPDYDKYLEFKQKEQLTLRMIGEIERLPVDEPKERKQDDIIINDTETDRDHGEAAKRG